MPRKVPNNTGKKYRTKTLEKRGEEPHEYRIQKTFWKEHTMDEAITWSAAEMEEKISQFYERYEARQLKVQGYRWWYPEDPKARILDLRYKK